MKKAYFCNKCQMMFFDEEERNKHQQDCKHKMSNLTDNDIMRDSYGRVPEWCKDDYSPPYKR